MIEGWAGRIIDGRYAVESVLGVGGMGLVLKARHRFTGADVALKVLRPELELDAEVQMRFLGEARAPNVIGHAGIVQVVDAGKAPDGLLYLVMELLQGRPLRMPMARGELTHPEIRRIMMELFDALAAAHVRGFVHRDLKPENVFLAGPTGVVKLLDFGIAKVLDAGLARVKTQTGVTLGTPAYMSPEQVNDPSTVDARTDLWAAGVMIYEMLCGRLPFTGATTGEFFIAVATKDPTPIRTYLPNAPPALEAFFARALARELFRRFASAQEMAQGFAALPLGFAPTAPSAAGGGATVATGIASPGSFAAGAAFTPQPVGPGASTPMPGYSTPMPGASTPMPGASTPMPDAYAPHPTGHLGKTIRPDLATPGPIAALPPPAAPSAESTMPMPSRSRGGLILGVIGVVALIAAVVVVLVSRRGGGEPVASTVPRDAGVIAKGADASVVVDAPTAVAVAIDAGVSAPKDAGALTAPRDAGALVPPKESFKELCEAGCQAARRCGVATPTCVKSCMTNPETRKCVSAARTATCPAMMQCAFELSCKTSVPRGEGSCRAAAACQQGCGTTDTSCQCRCSAAMHPQHALTLYQLWTCRRNCGHEATCVAKKCGALVMACATK